MRKCSLDKNFQKITNLYENLKSIQVRLRNNIMWTKDEKYGSGIKEQKKKRNIIWMRNEKKEAGQQKRTTDGEKTHVSSELSIQKL